MSEKVSSIGMQTLGNSPGSSRVASLGVQTLFTAPAKARVSMVGLQLLVDELPYKTIQPESGALLTLNYI